MSTALRPLPLPAPSQGVKVAVAMGTIYVLWSTTFMAIRFTLDGLPPMTLCALRYVAAGLVMLAVGRLSGAPRPTWAQVRGAAVLGLVLILAPNGPVAWAEQTIPTGVTSLLGACTPLFVLAVGAVTRAAEPPTPRGLVGIVLGLVGVVVLVGPQLAHGLGAAATAQVALLAGSLTCACGMVLGKRLQTPESAAYNSGLTMLAGGIAFVPCALIHGEAMPVGVPTHCWVGLAYLVVFGSCLGFSAFSWLVKHARPTLVATTSYVNPVLAMLVGMAVLHEALTPAVLLAACLILASVGLVARRR